jgi:hypothetical protein
MFTIVSSYVICFSDIIGVVHEVKPDKKSFGSKKLPTNFSLADASYDPFISFVHYRFQLSHEYALN